MKQNKALSRALLAGLLSLASGCALLGKSAPLTPRYFSPPLEARANAQSAAHSELRLRMGRIQAGLNLRERMAYRTSDEEVGYYDDRRWTERPEVYLRRALSRSLFEVRGITRAVGGAAPTLDAELVAFEELKGDEHKVKVEVVMTLDDSARGAVERTITVKRPVDGTDKDDPQPVVQALGRALGDVVAQMSDHIIEHLAQTPPPEPTTAPPPGTTTTTLTTETAPPGAAPSR